MPVAPLPHEIHTIRIVGYNVPTSSDRDRETNEWIVDCNTASSLVHDVDRIVPITQRDEMLFRSHGLTTGQDHLFGIDSRLRRFENIFLWPIAVEGDGRESDNVFFRLCIEKLLDYIQRPSFSWSVHYGRAEEFDRALQRIERICQRQRASVLTNRPPSRTASSVLREYTVFDSQKSVADSDCHTRQSATTIAESNDDTSMSQTTAVSHTPETVRSDRNDVDMLAEDQTTNMEGALIQPFPASLLTQLNEVVGLLPLEKQVTPMDEDEPQVPSTRRTQRLNSADVIAALEAAGLPTSPRFEEHSNPIPQMQKDAGKLSRTPFPVSEFERIPQRARANVRAARVILAKIKLLAIDPDPRASAQGRRYSIASEKHAILSMSASYTLNIGDSNFHDLSVGEALRRAFHRYDRDDFDGNGNCAVPVGNSSSASVRMPSGRVRSAESAERALLLVAIRLLRHRFMYEHEGERIPGRHYARDFDDQIPRSSMCKSAPSATQPQRGNALIRRSKLLCRIIVACGHPCIVLVLVRMAIRLGVRLVMLLDDLPIEAFCQWVATGHASSTRLHIAPRHVSPSYSDGEQLEADLSWAHQHILLPLLATARQRIPAHFFMLDARVRCSVDKCLASLVPHSSQERYAEFLRGRARDDQWQLGRVRIEGGGQSARHPGISSAPGNDDNNCPNSSTLSESGSASHTTFDVETPQFCVETAHRTFVAFDVDHFGEQSDRFHPPPAFLVNRTLELTLEM